MLRGNTFKTEKEMFKALSLQPAVIHGVESLVLR